MLPLQLAWNILGNGEKLWKKPQQSKELLTFIRSYILHLPYCSQKHLRSNGFEKPGTPNSKEGQLERMKGILRPFAIQTLHSGSSIILPWIWQSMAPALDVSELLIFDTQLRYYISSVQAQYCCLWSKASPVIKDMCLTPSREKHQWYPYLNVEWKFCSLLFSL